VSVGEQLFAVKSAVVLCYKRHKLRRQITPDSAQSPVVNPKSFEPKFETPEPGYFDFGDAVEARVLKRHVTLEDIRSTNPFITTEEEAAPSPLQRRNSIKILLSESNS